MSFKRRHPSHATIVAYLALFIALATGVSYAATKITNSGQIAKNVVKSKHLKDGTVLGKDIKDGAVSNADIGDGSVAGAEVKDASLSGKDVLDASLSGTDIAQSSIGGADVANNSITGVDLNLSQLGFGQTFSVQNFSELALDDGAGFLEPRIPEGTLATLEVPAGKYLLAARILIRANGNDGGALCGVFANGSKIGSAAGSTDEGDFGLSQSTFDSVDVTQVADFDVPTTLIYACSDGNSGDVRGSARGIDAIKLPG